MSGFKTLVFEIEDNHTLEIRDCTPLPDPNVPKKRGRKSSAYNLVQILNNKETVLMSADNKIGLTKLENIAEGYRLGIQNLVS